MKLQENALRLYAVTDRAWAADEAALLSQVEAAIDGGAGMVQLREKQLEEGAFFKEAERFVALCRRKGVISIINDNVAVALRTGADGVHVGQEDLAAGRVRELLGHAALSTTQLYVHVTQDRVKRAYTQAHPRAQEK